MTNQEKRIKEACDQMVQALNKFVEYIEANPSKMINGNSHVQILPEEITE